MRGRQKLVVAGAFGGLAAVTAAASTAFACTPLASVTVRDPIVGENVYGVVDPGMDVNIRTVNFNPVTENNRPWTASEVLVVLQAAEVEGYVTPAPKVLASLPAPPEDAPKANMESRVVLPDADELDTFGQYTVSAYQFRTDTGEMKGSDSAPLAVRGGRLAREVKPPPPTRPVTTITQSPTTATATATASTAIPDREQTSPGVPSPQSPTSGPAGTRQLTSRSADAPATADAAEAPTPAEQAVARIPAVPGSDAVELLERLNGQAQPSAADLWSGMDASRLPNLLGGEAPPGPSRGVPVGGLLLAGGVLALAAVAVAEGRRRLAVSRITLR